MRKLLGLDSDDDSNDGESRSDQAESSGEEKGSEDDEAMEKEIKFIPGKKSLEENIRKKLHPKMSLKSSRLGRSIRRSANINEKNADKLAGIKEAGIPKSVGRTQRNQLRVKMMIILLSMRIIKMKAQRKESRRERLSRMQTKSFLGVKKRKNELELLLASEDDVKQARDYDIRGIQRMEKIKGKKLSGSRKRKEEKLAADVSGTGFKVNVHDNRFSAVLDGSDGLFGIDKTDPNFKDTSAMRDILSEQTKRRKKKRQRTKSDSVAPDANAESAGKSIGSSALSSLVQRLKTKVSKNIQ